MNEELLDVGLPKWPQMVVWGESIICGHLGKSHVQCLHTKELGANAYAATMRRLFPNMKIYAGSRMD